MRKNVLSAVLLGAAIGGTKHAATGDGVTVAPASSVSSFVLILPPRIQPPRLPWADELTAGNPKAARWCRLSNDVHGDGVYFIGEIYGLVVDGRDVDAVIKAFDELELAEGQSVTLHVHRAGDEMPECHRRERFHGLATRGDKL